MRDDDCQPYPQLHKSCHPAVTAMMWRAGGLALTPLCAATLTAPPAQARDDIWAAMPMAPSAPGMASPLAMSEPPIARARTTATLAAAAPLQPTLALQDADHRRPHDAAQRPSASAAGWDIYASASINAVTDRNDKTRTYSVAAAPAIVLTRELGAARLAVDALAELPLSDSAGRNGLRYRFGVDWNYQPANDMAFDLKFDLARLSGDVIAIDRGFRPAAVFDGLQSVCGAASATLLSCRRASASARMLKRAGDFIFSAEASAATGNWRSQPATFQNSGDASLIRLRISRTFSHRFEPFVEASTGWQRVGHVQGGRNRFITGATFPEISLFSGSLFSGVDLPVNGPPLPVLGGAMSWSPRRTIVLGIRAGTGSASVLPALPAETYASAWSTGSWRPGRQTQAGVHARWSISSSVDLNISAGWSRAHWRTPLASGARVTEHDTEASATLIWSPASQWQARFDLTAIRRSGAPAQRQRRVIAAISLRRLL